MKERRSLALILGLVSSAVFVALAARHLELAKVRSALASAALWPWVPLASVVYLSGHWVRGMRTRLLVSRDARLTVPSATNVVVLGYAVNNVLPARLGELARAGMLSRLTGLPFMQSASVTLLERILDGLSLLFLLVLGSSMSAAVPWRDQILRVGATVFGLASVFVALAIAKPAFLVSITGTLTRPFGNRLHGVAVRVAEQLCAGVAYLRNARALLATVGLSLTVWSIEAAMFLTVLPAFGLPADPRLAIAATAVTNLGNIAPSTPGYVGPFHFFCMSSLVAAGVNESVAFSYAVVVHLSFYVPITLWGVGIAFAYGVSFSEVVSRARVARPLANLDPTSGRVLHIRPSLDQPAASTVAMCDALLPMEELPDGIDSKELLQDAARFVEQETRDLPGRLAWMFAVGLWSVRCLCWLRFGRPLCRLPRERRKLFLEGWAHGSVPQVRQFFRALRSVALLAFYEHPQVRPLYMPTLTSLHAESGSA